MQMNVGPGNGPENMQHGHYLIDESYSDLRTRGRAALAGKWKMAVIAILIFLVVTQLVPNILDLFFGTEKAVDMSRYFGERASGLGDMNITVKQSPVTGLYTFLVIPPLTYGIMQFFLDIVRGNACMVTDIFSGFEKFLKTLWLTVFMYVFILLWALIPIAGIFLAVRAMIRYSQAYCVMCDNPDLPVPLCVEESKRLMEGNKMYYFVLNLSFIGWFALAVAAVAVIAFLCGMLLFPLMATDFGGSIVRILAVALGLIPASIPLAYSYATDRVFYEMVSGRKPGQTTFVRDM